MNLMCSQSLIIINGECGDMGVVQFIKILLVEDNNADARLFEEAFKESCFKNELYTVKDGCEAIEFLNQENIYSDAPRPDLILLDLDLPQISGLDVLKKVKNDAALKLIPVMILSASLSDKDMMYAYKYHANAFIIKPGDYPSLIRFSDSLGEFWSRWVRLPGEAEYNQM
ncbi:MAG: response regulator [Methanobacterium sp.]